MKVRELILKLGATGAVVLRDKKNERQQNQKYKKIIKNRKITNTKLKIQKDLKNQKVIVPRFCSLLWQQRHESVGNTK